MEQNRIKTFVGFAIKARKIQYGVDNVTTAKKRAEIILYDPSLSVGSTDKLTAYAKKEKIDVFSVNIEGILPNRNCKALGITDINLANAVKSELKES